MKLFLDVVKFNLSHCTNALRYSDDVKELWTLGYTLFTGKLISFMGGFKNDGEIANEQINRNDVLSQDAIKIKCCCSRY